MNGAESLLKTLVLNDVDVCFANPGTSEVHFVSALNEVLEMRAVLGLFEGVCSGAADGYARIAKKPAATLLHLGPGLGNATANLHNARRANSPVVNVVGDHATHHLKYDAPLTMDIEALASTFSGWVRSSKISTDVARDTADAITASMQPPGQISTLILPADCAWAEGSSPVLMQPPALPENVDSTTVDEIAQVLRLEEPALILLNGSAMLEEAQILAGAIAQVSGAQLMADWRITYHPQGAGRGIIPRFPYPIDQGLQVMEKFAHLILVGAKAPVSFFAYPDKPGWLTPESCKIHTLTEENQDHLQALIALAEALHAPIGKQTTHRLNQPPRPTGELDSPKVWQAMAALMPEHSILCNEAVTSGRGFEAQTGGAPPHVVLPLTGGAIGIGLPLAIGAAVAAPDRKVFAMQADGSAMYTLQALWTHAREKLDIVTVLFSNRKYQVLYNEVRNMKAAELGPGAAQLFELGNPNLDWVALATGMGVSATKAETAEAFCTQLEHAVKTPGPHLIEVVL